MNIFKTPAFWFSLWGTLTGTAAIILTWFSYRKDKTDLKIDASLSVVRDNVEDVPHWQIEINFRNTGRRPCYIDKVDLEFPPVESVKYGEIKLDQVIAIRMGIFNSKQTGLISLDENQKHTITFQVPESILQMLVHQLKEQATLLIRDSLGHEYSCKFNLPAEEHVVIRKKDDKNNITTESAGGRGK